MQVLARAFKLAAMTRMPASERQTYLAEDENYGTDVFRVTDIDPLRNISLDCWYGYIYTRNDSPYRLQETLRPQLDGLEVVWPMIAEGQEDIEIDVPAGLDHVIILRRTAPHCQFGLQFLTHPRELEDDEMIEIAKSMDETNLFGDSKAFYKLYNTAKGAVFYFENGERLKTFRCTFELGLENLYIVGEPNSAVKFTVELRPGQSAVKLLKSVLDGDNTGFDMKFDFKLDDV